MSRLGAVVRLSRPFTLLAPALGMVSGSLVALGAARAALPAGDEGYGLLAAAWPRILAGAALAALLNTSSNAVNQIFDLEIDRVNKPDRPLPAGHLSIREAWVVTVAAAAAALAVAAGLDLTLTMLATDLPRTGALAERWPWPTLLIVAFTAAVVYSYSGPPLRTKRFWWAANPTIAIPRGTLLFIAGWTAARGWGGLDSMFPWVLGGMYGLFILGAATTKDYADIPGDRAEGCITIPIRFGIRRSIWITAPFLVLPWLVLPWGVFAHGERTPSRLALAGLGIALALWGGWIVRLLLRDPEALTTSKTHPSWNHMYLLMIVAQAGLAATFWLFPR